MSDFSLDDELVLDYLAESREHLATIETDLLAIEDVFDAVFEAIGGCLLRITSPKSHQPRSLGARKTGNHALSGVMSKTENAITLHREPLYQNRRLR